MDVNTDTLFSILGAATAIWSFGVTVSAIRADASERDLALKTIIQALTILLLEQGRLVRDRRNNGEASREAT